MPRYATVVFDCDSTLSTIEGIEEISAGRRAEVEALTEAAMRGAIPLEEVYGRRLELARPTRARVEALGHRYIETLVPDTRETIAALRGEALEVRVISGGLLPAVRILARELGLRDDDVAAVDLRFDDQGRYAGFDTTSPLARSGGKRVVLEQWATTLPRPILMIGDGATDLEVRPVVDSFVAFAGVVERPIVVEAADIVVRARSLAPILPIALGGDAPRNTAALEVFWRGLRALEQTDGSMNLNPD